MPFPLVLPASLLAFSPSGPTVGMQTSTGSARLLLPVPTLPALVLPQMRVFNDSEETAYIAFGDDTVVARAWTGPPPADCDYVLPPMAVIVLTPPLGLLYAACILYAGNGGVYFTPGLGVWAG